VLRLLQRQLEAVYRTAAPDISQFLVDDEQLEQLVGDEARHADEWVLVRETDEGLDLAVWIADRHRALLTEAGDPSRAMDAGFQAFCAAVEGVSHFLLLVERARRAEPLRLLELEAQAEVDKFVCARLHAPARSREWRARLFRDVDLHDGLSTEERHRYVEAGRLAEGLCAHLDRHPHDAARLRDLRGFWRASGHQRLERMRRLAA
jgi:hypothetical protein